MLSKEEIELRRAGLKATYPDNGGCHESIDALCDLALVGLSVQEGLKDAREVAWKIRSGDSQTVDSWDMRMDHDGPLPQEWKFDLSEEKAAQLIAAFALKQKGEIVAEFDSQLITVEGTNTGVLYGCPPLPLIVGRPMRVTISLPQQEQE